MHRSARAADYVAGFVGEEFQYGASADAYVKAPAPAEAPTVSGRKSSWTDEQEKIARSNVEHVQLRKDLCLFRSQSVQCQKGGLKDVYDPDTARVGQFFSNDIVIPLGMILEYNKPMYVCWFELQTDVSLLDEKYSFRDDDPAWFFEDFEAWKRRDFIPNLDARYKTSSIDGRYLPLHEFFRSNEFEDSAYDNEFEIFLSSEQTNDWEGVKLIEASRLVSPDEAKSIIDKFIRADDYDKHKLRKQLFDSWPWKRLLKKISE